jgi:hypothetical protein
VIKVTIGNNLKRQDHMIDEGKTLREALEDAGVDYTMGICHLDGAPIQAGDLDKSFSDFNVKDHCYLLNVVKADNAA